MSLKQIQRNYINRLDKYDLRIDIATIKKDKIKYIGKRRPKNVGKEELRT